MFYNYHSHTALCGHASGTPREYIETAVAGGVRVMGFSDHAPFRFPDGYESGHRVKTKDAQGYMQTIRQLREEYRDRIELYVGFEMEYYPKYFDDMLAYVRSLGAEYLILALHYLQNEYPDGVYSGTETESEALLEEYVDNAIAAMHTGVFTYLAHPDLMRYVGDDEIYIRHMRRLCAEAARLNFPLEINFLGIRESRHYPRALFWQIAGEEGSPVVFGCDAHDTPSACDQASFRKAMEMVKTYRLNLIEKPELVRL